MEEKEEKVKKIMLNKEDYEQIKQKIKLFNTLLMFPDDSLPICFFILTYIQIPIVFVKVEMFPLH